MFWFKYLLLSLISSITLMITLFSYAKISDNYKINIVSRDGFKQEWYIIDLISFLSAGMCKIEFK